MKIPEVLMDKALDEIWGITSTRAEYQKKIDEAVVELKEYEMLYAALKKKLSVKEFKAYKKLKGYRLRHFKDEVQRRKEDLKQFKATYFLVEDVQEFFKGLQDVTTNEQMVFRPNPQDTGKKRFICDNCGKKWWTKIKPKQCSKCKSKKIVQYFRM